MIASEGEEYDFILISVASGKIEDAMKKLFAENELTSRIMT